MKRWYRRLWAHKSLMDMQSLLSQSGPERMDSSKCFWPTSMYIRGRGPGVMPTVGLLQKGLTQRPEARGGVLGLPHTRRCFRVSGGSVDCLLTHQYLTLRSCKTESVLTTCIVTLVRASSSLLGWQRPERSHCRVVGPRAAGHSGKLAQKMICTMKSPLNHCLSPVPDLLFLLCSPETFL